MAAITATAATGRWGRGGKALHAAVAGWLLLAGPAAPAPSAPALIRCTPTSYTLAGGAPQASAHPIVAALVRAKPGTRIRLDPGVYAPFTIGLESQAPSNARAAGGAPGRPVVIDGGGQARIRAAADGDTIGIDQRVPNGHITFRGLDIETGTRAGILFYRQQGDRVHEGYTFEDCNLLGGWDHVTQRGRRSKWGLWAHSLKDFRFAGTRVPARVQGVRSEHGFYIQNPRGNVTIENVRGELLGRTFCQFTARANEGPPGQGTILVRRCDVRDVGLSRDDGFKGGAAFTVAGRLRGRIVFEANRYRAGFDPFVRTLTTPTRPYGTGAFVAWDKGAGAPNATLVLQDNDFRFAAGCGDRPVVSIGGCERVELIGANHFESGGTFDALALDPIDAQGRAVNSANGAVLLAPTTTLGGALTVGGAVANEATRARLRSGAR